MKKTLLIIVGLCMSQTFAQAQDLPKHEFGLNTNFSNVGFLWKMRLKENYYLRQTYMLALIGNDLGFRYHSFAYNLGLEKRLSLTEKFQLFHGVDIRYKSENYEPHFKVNSFGLHYVAGFQYNPISSFGMGMEIAPGFRMDRHKDGGNFYQIVTPVSLHMVYRFNANKKKGKPKI